MPKSSLLATLTGQPGVGKTSLARELLALFAKEQMVMLTSTTTRAPRASDLSGEYEYVSLECFRDIERGDGFAWSVSHSGALYGTRKERFAAACTSGLHLAILTPPYVHEARRLAAQFGILGAGDTCGLQHIYLNAPEHVLRARMHSRGDDPETIERRLEETKGWRVDMNASPHLFLETAPTVQEVAMLAATRIEHWYYQS